jgi:hypothetical protein
MLEGLSDKIDFSTTDPHGTTVRVEKYLRYESPSAAYEATKMDTGNGSAVTATKS